MLVCFDLQDGLDETIKRGKAWVKVLGFAPNAFALLSMRAPSSMVPKVYQHQLEHEHHFEDANKLNPLL